MVLPPTLRAAAASTEAQGDRLDALSLLGRNGFGGSPGLLVAMVCADAALALACFSMPLGMLVLLRRRPWTGFVPLALLLGAFLLACGLAQLLDIWSIWVPGNAPQAWAKVLAALVAVATVGAAWRLVPALAQAARTGQSQAASDALEREVGKRRSAEDYVADLEQDLSLTLASIDAGLITTDTAGRVARMNAVAERITGWTQQEAAGRSYWEVFTHLDRVAADTERDVVQVVAERGYTVETAHRVTALSRHGVRTPTELNLALARGRDGVVRGVLAVLKDVTRMNQAEEAARRMAAIVESSSDAIIGKTLDGRITSWNGAAARLFGYTAQEAIGQSVRMLLPPDRLDEEMEILANIGDGQVVAPFDTVRLAKGGRPIELSVTISPIRDGGGRIVGGSKIARDITERRRTLAALGESEARLRFALEVAQIGDWDLDLRSGNIRRSIRHDHCFGYDSLQPEWSIATFLKHVHPQEQAEVALSYRRALLKDADWDTQCRVIWPDGSPHWIHIQGSTRYETGHPHRMLGIVADITERKLADSARQQALRLENENRQIQESNRLKSQFLANMSHELRSPLNAIIGFSDLLHGDLLRIEPAKQQQYIGHIRSSGRHLLQLINDVLDLSKVESGKFEFFPEPVDLPALVDEVVAVLYTQIQAKGQRVEVVLEPAVSRVVVDPARLKQVLFNYLSNANKFTPERGSITVRAGADRPGFFRLEVEDTGIGIAPADLPRLFVEFQQLDASFTKRHQGTGLGLALTRRMVEAQGGAVGVRSVAGRGSVFSLTLPLAAAMLQQPVPEQPASDLAPAPFGAALGAQWLVIEDDPREQARIAATLTASGYRVDVASSVAQALSRADEKGYDALSLDLMGGSPGGLDVLAQMRGARRTGASAVAAITLDSRSDGTAAFSVADVLTKPLRADEITFALERFGLAHRSDVRIMVIDDDTVALALMRATLDDCGVSSACYLDGRDALRELDRQAPDAIILDLLMPRFSGFEVMDELRAQPRWRDVPVFIWTSMVLTDSEYDLLAMSAATILRKGGGGVESLLERLQRWRPAARVSEDQHA